MTAIHPLIICGGNGTRLWPVSRTQSPKQFQKVGGPDTRTFFQEAVLRHVGDGYAEPTIVSGIRHRDTVAAQLREIGVTARIILEPMGRNTGPAVLAAALTLCARDPGALMVVVPADHVINGDINRTILGQRDAASAGHIITFGIKPRHAETGFGYITDGGPMIEHPGLHKVERFVEKPPLRKARLLVESDIAYWASGLSMFAASTLITEYERFDAPSVDAVRQAIVTGRVAADGLELNPEHFGLAQSGPTESIVFERTARIALAPLDVEWSDVGSWTAMYGISKSNPQGNVFQGDVIAVETTNSMVRSTSRLVTVVGMKDVIVVDTPDALLVTRVGHCQSVKKVAEYLKKGERIEAEKHLPERPKNHATPFGGMSPMFQNDHIEMVSATIAPGQSMLLDPVNNREVLVARGEVTVATLKGKEQLGPGQRKDLVSTLPSLLMNATGTEVEVIILTLLGEQKEEQPEAFGPHPSAAPDTQPRGPQDPLPLYA
jgi:mannose-1-phosphate guanylyltransferase/mannose-6-phosphate isomerase